MQLTGLGEHTTKLATLFHVRKHQLSFMPLSHIENETLRQRFLTH